MKKSSLTRLGVSAASLALLLTAVGSNVAGSYAAGTKTLYILTAGDDILHMDPQRNYTGEDMAFTSAYLNRTLTQYTYSSVAKTASKIIGDMSTNAGLKLNGGKDWAFPLVSGVKWEDGTLVKCADFKYGISRTFAQDVITDGPLYAIQYLDIPFIDDDLNNGSEYPGPYKANASEQAMFNRAVECLSKTVNGKTTETLLIHLNQPIGDFNGATTLTAFAAVKKSAESAAPSIDAYDNEPLSNGPYKILSHGGFPKSLVLVKNNEWEASLDPTRSQAFDRIEYDFGLPPEVVTDRLMQDSKDDRYAISPDGIYPEQLDKVMTSDDYANRRVTGFDPYVTYTAINAKLVPNQTLRNAIQIAWPREQLRQMGGGDYAGTLADGVIKPSMGQDYKATNLWGTSTLKKDANGKPLNSSLISSWRCTKPGILGICVPPTGDPAAAKAKIAAAGLSDNKYLNVTYDYSDRGSDITKKAVALVKQQLEAAGFDVTLNAITTGYYGYVLSSKQHELSNAGWGPDWGNASTVIPPLFTPNGGFDLTHFSLASFQKSVMQAMQTTSRTQQAKQWQALNADAMQRGLAVPKLFSNTQRLVGSKVNNAYIWAPYGSYPYAKLTVD